MSITKHKYKRWSQELNKITNRYKQSFLESRITIHILETMAKDSENEWELYKKGIQGYQHFKESRPLDGLQA